MLINHIALFVTQILLVCLMVVLKETLDTHNLLQPGPLLSPLFLSLPPSLSSHLSLFQFPLVWSFFSSTLPVFYHFGAWSLCFAAFQSPHPWECRQMFDQNMHKHKDAHRQAGVFSAALSQHKLIVVYTVEVVWLCSKGEHGLYPWPLRCFVHTMLHNIKLNNHF